MVIVSAIEHLVLFRVKEGVEPAIVAAWLDGLRSLRSLPVVLYLAAGPILRCRGPIQFNHALHCRYRTAEDFAAYTLHPAHQAVVKSFATSLSEGPTAVDWVTELDEEALRLKPPSVIRATLARLKEGTEPEQKRELLGCLRREGEMSPGAQQVSFGENFSPERANGFVVASLRVFPSLESLELLEITGSLPGTMMEAAGDVVTVDFATS